MLLSVILKNWTSCYLFGEAGNKAGRLPSLLTENSLDLFITEGRAIRKFRF